MSTQTAIEWADSTFNPWIGCTKISPACDHCYAERDFDHRRHVVQWGAGQPRKRTSAANWKLPLRWNSQHEAFFAEHGRRRRVFCASLADVFDNEVDPQWRADLFALIAATPNLDWLLLTKRIGNVAKMLGDYHTVPLLPNIWLGATICNQEEADRDIPKLLSVPAAVRFVSIEPMLGSIDLRRAHVAPVKLARVDWVIVGGESGPRARPMSPDWVRSLRDQCAAAGVPFHFKQWGEWIPMLGQAEGVSVQPEKATTSDGWVMGFAGKKAAGRRLDGVQHDGYPEREA